jgi:tetratricopeptide (TPR) repeat protein
VAAGCIAVLIAAPTAWLYLKDASPLHFKVSPSRETAPVSRMAEGMPPPQPAAPKIAVTEPTARPAASLRRDQSACTANDPDRKISGCTEIIEDHAQSPSDRAFAYLERGVALAGKGELDKAMSDFNEAIRLNPTLATAYFNRSLLRRAKGDLDGAKADRDQATRLDPGYGSR